ncbi:hypothetical protein Tco_0956159 [Tanacetum coccineum]|uniref:Uncharacterized protein n=1 Tax=Tanacetum coccineum TaxID=301880 RepID=A0ABQ5E979_9ASTR
MKKLLLFCFSFRVTNEANHDAKSRCYVYECDITNGMGVESKNGQQVKSVTISSLSLPGFMEPHVGLMHCRKYVHGKEQIVITPLSISAGVQGIVLGMLGDFIDYEECYSSTWFYAVSLMVYSRIIHVMVETMSRLFSPAKIIYPTIDEDPFGYLERKLKVLNVIKVESSIWIEASFERYDELSNFLMSKGFTKDADHAGCLDTRKSTSRGIQFLGENLVSWMLKKRDCTVMSTAEAEDVALFASCAQVMWIRIQLKDYGFDYNKIPLYCDSQTEYQLADMFTKDLSQDKFEYLVRRIGTRCLTSVELEVLENETA